MTASGDLGPDDLGHMGVTFAKAPGARIVMITTAPERGTDATRLGADAVPASHDADAMAARGGASMGAGGLSTTPGTD